MPEKDKDKNKKKKKDSEWFHEAIIKDKDDFEGGSFDCKCDEDQNGMWVTTGTLIENGKIEAQKYEFSPHQWTEKQAKDWLKKNDIDFIKFKVAINKVDSNSEIIRSVSRADFLFEEFMTDRFKKTDEGFYTGRAVITNVGVFPYLVEDEDGNTKVRWELRLPEEVFDSESVNTLKMSPMTNNHPKELVNSDNVQKLQTGFVGDSLMFDAYHISAPITITEKKAVDDAENGKLGLSAGYTVDIEIRSGNWMGVPYDAIQRNIRYNHVAQVDRGRAGDDARMKIDSLHKDGFRFDGYCIDVDKHKIKTNLKKEDNNMPDLKTVKIDSIDREAEAEVIIELNNRQDKVDKLQEENETLTKDKDEVQGKLDSANEELETAKKDLEEAKKDQPEKVDEAVETRLSLVELAGKFDIELKKDEDEKIKLTNDEIQKAITLKAYPESESKYDEGSDEYKSARFDSAVEYLEEKSKKDKQDDDTAADNANDITGDADDKDNIPDSEKTSDQKHDEYVKNLKNAHTKTSKDKK